MQSLLTAVLMAILRGTLFWVSARLVEHGVTEEQIEQLIAGLAGLISIVLWWFWIKVRERLRLLVALDQPRGATEADVRQVIARRKRRGTYVSGRDA